MKKFFLLTLISLASNSFCAELSNEELKWIDEINKEYLKPYTITGTIAKHETFGLYIKADNDKTKYVFENIEIKVGTRGKFTLKNKADCICTLENSQPVKIEKFEECDE